jgi:hypothetical protein
MRKRFKRAIAAFLAKDHDFDADPQVVTGGTRVTIHVGSTSVTLTDSQARNLWAELGQAIRNRKKPSNLSVDDQ